MVSYATVTDVSNELNGLVIDATTTPSTTTVETWIEQESEKLKSDTNQLWGQETITDELLDYDGSGNLLLDYAPVISITKLENERNGMNATSESWLTLVEGRTSSGSFIVYKEEGDLQFHGSVVPIIGNLNMRVTYEAGYAPVSPVVLSYVAKAASLRVIEAVVNSQASEEGGNITVDVISLTDPSNFSVGRVRQLKTDLIDLKNQLGSLKVYRYNRNGN
jgi:hypothetical protein